MKTPISNKNNALNNILEPQEKKVRYLGPADCWTCPRTCSNCRLTIHQAYKFENLLTWEVAFSCYDCLKVLLAGPLTAEAVSQPVIKEFLLQHSRLVELNKKEATEQGLNRYEQAEQTRIYELRDKTFSQIRAAIAKYYQAAINGDYRFDGMPTISRGIKGWAEEKIWRLLIAIGEPNHWRVNPEPSYWEEAN